MKPGSARWVLYSALVALYLLHNDFWQWHDSRVVLWLPVGLLYHLVYCLVVSVIMALIVHLAWPYVNGRGSGS